MNKEAMNKEEVRTFGNSQVLLTTDWTNRHITITGEAGGRTATVSRSLGSELWGVTFRLTSRILELLEVDEDHTILVDAAIKFVANGEFPSASHFDALDKIRQRELDLVRGLVHKLRRPTRPRRPRATV